ncbi:HK97-gp10 family putative phage morphogenesis protein [Streptomyces viridochromogenes]|uniref:HK97-gp10 family putative phage morphogenesis protein n=1 Tax=Streptomyces viridochromogenes TaxID=1938 RepID=UPI00069CD75C|nr:HK97-gp10 family putative phage morphogenesis protein [Streptomyces viridochromogenes]KOG22000.1 hypothetical protein ADK36_13750 [Streptomyces viridochromogenes]
MNAAFSGLRTALARLRLIPARVNEARSEALRDWAEALEKTAKDLAPVRRGVLRDSIQAKVNESSGKAWVRVDPTQSLDYPYYVEKGTSKMEAQPFLGPAAQIHRRTGERALRRAVPRRLGR